MVSIFLTAAKNRPNDTALSLVTSTSSETVITNHQLLQAKNLGRVQISEEIHITVYPSYRNAPKEEKLPIHSLISLLVPAATLVSALIAFRVSDANGWEAIFPSISTCPIVMKLVVWMTLISVVIYEQSFYHYSYGGKNRLLEGNQNNVGLEVVLDDGVLNPAEGVGATGIDINMDEVDTHVNIDMEDPALEMLKKPISTSESNDSGRVNVNEKISMANEPTQLKADGSENGASRDEGQPLVQSNSESEQSIANTPSSTSISTKETSSNSIPALRSRNSFQNKSNVDPPDAHAKERVQTQAPVASNATKTNDAVTVAATAKPHSAPKVAPAPIPPSPSRSAPGSIPFRFIRATKGDVAAAKERWAETCKWRAQQSMDTCLVEPHPQLQLIKNNYPHYFHLRGKKNECCYYEQPAKMNIPEMKKYGITTEKLLKHYAICCDYMWNMIEDSEEGKSIYVIDLDGIGFRDFAGDVVDFVKRASSFTGDHYPERSGSIFIINVPSWFSVIWNVVKPMVDDVTKEKIKILRYGKEAITKALMEKIDLENIPPEYGGQSMSLGQSPEEIAFVKHFEELNKKQAKQS